MQPRGRHVTGTAAPGTKQREPCASALWDLPNANTAEFWIRKAMQLELQGDHEVRTLYLASISMTCHEHIQQFPCQRLCYCMLAYMSWSVEPRMHSSSNKPSAWRAGGQTGFSGCQEAQGGTCSRLAQARPHDQLHETKAAVTDAYVSIFNLHISATHSACSMSICSAAVLMQLAAACIALEKFLSPLLVSWSCMQAHSSCWACYAVRCRSLRNVLLVISHRCSRHHLLTWLRMAK